MITSEKISVQGFEGTISRDSSLTGARPGVLAARAMRSPTPLPMRRMTGCSMTHAAMRGRGRRWWRF